MTDALEAASAQGWHEENHNAERTGWLRAAVLGANDGILSTAGLIVGVASAGQPANVTVMTGVAGLIAGAISMAAGEYVSVKSQADAEEVDKRIEARALKTHPEAEREELVQIYEKRGLDRTLAEAVTDQLMAHDALGTHMRDEIGITEELSAQPVQAAVSSAASFIVGAAVPITAVLLAPDDRIIPLVVAVTLLLLATLGAIGARVGRASMVRGAGRVLFWGVVAMLATAGIGSLFGTDIG